MLHQTVTMPSVTPPVETASSVSSHEAGLSQEKDFYVFSETVQEGSESYRNNQVSVVKNGFLCESEGNIREKLI